MLIEHWNRKIGSKNRNLRNETRIVHKPVARRLYPSIKIFVPNPWRAKGVARCDAVGSEDGSCDLRQRTAKRMACDINRALILVRHIRWHECFMQRSLAHVGLERMERLIKSLVDQKFWICPRRVQHIDLDICIPISSALGSAKRDHNAVPASLAEGDVPAPNGSGLSKSAASRRFVALSAARLKEWMGSDLSDLGLLVIQIDGIHMDEDMTLVAAIGVDVNGDKHPLGLVEGATENAATVQALIDNLVERGLDPAVPRLFIIDGSKALSKAIRATFGRDAAIQRCQIHKARNIMDRLPKSMHAQVRRVLRQAWEMDDADSTI